MSSQPQEGSTWRREGGGALAGHAPWRARSGRSCACAVAAQAYASRSRGFSFCTVPGPRSQLPSYGFCHNVLYLIDSKHAQMSPADFSWEPICTCLQLCCENLNVLDGKCYWQGIIKKKRKEKIILFPAVGTAHVVLTVFCTNIYKADNIPIQCLPLELSLNASSIQ